MPHGVGCRYRFAFTLRLDLAHDVCWAEWKRKTMKTFFAVRGCRRFNLVTKFGKLEGTVIVLYKEELNIIPEDEEKKYQVKTISFSINNKEKLWKVYSEHILYLITEKILNLARNHWITRWQLRPMSCSLGFLLFSWKESKWLTIVNREDETY